MWGRGPFILLLPTSPAEKPVIVYAFRRRCWRVVETVQPTQQKTQRAPIISQNPHFNKRQKSIKEDADPSFFNFFLETWQKRLFFVCVVRWVATGCILILQAFDP